MQDTLLLIWAIDTSPPSCEDISVAIPMFSNGRLLRAQLGPRKNKEKSR